MTVEEKMEKKKILEKIKELKMVADEKKKVAWAAKRADRAAKVAAKVPRLFTAEATYDELVDYSKLTQEKKRVQYEIDILNDIFKPK